MHRRLGTVDSRGVVLRDGRGTDARLLIVTGLVLMAAGNYWLSRMNLGIGPWDVVWPRVSESEMSSATRRGSAGSDMADSFLGA